MAAVTRTIIVFQSGLPTCAIWLARASSSTRTRGTKNSASKNRRRTDREGGTRLAVSKRRLPRFQETTSASGGGGVKRARNQRIRPPSRTTSQTTADGTSTDRKRLPNRSGANAVSKTNCSGQERGPQL